MDYGYLEGTEPNVVNEKKERYTQVYQVTHDREGNRLPYMRRSFISFSYGGKIIEDFNLIAIIENNQIQRNMYADFSDNVTESEVYDGQIYWDTHYDSNSLDLALFTDGMTERQMDDFRRWFVPGKYRELILSEHPNRGILARISQPPVISMLPFEEKTEIKIAGTAYATSTTLYKGKIEVSFVMDDPFWYSLTNVLDKQNDEGECDGKWIDATGQRKFILEDKDAIKVILEDGVPCAVMEHDATITTPPDEMDISTDSGVILLGENNIIAVDESLNYMASRISTEEGNINTDSNLETIEKPNVGAAIDYGHVAFIYKVSDIGLTIEASTDIEKKPRYFYYAGTAPCAPTITFTMTPVIASGYIISPRNSIGNITGNTYSTITIESENKKEFRFTTPSIWTGYNQAIWVFKNLTVGISWEEVRQMIRDNVKHYAPRAYAIKIIDDISGDSSSTSDGSGSNLVNNMEGFLKNGNSVYPATFTFDCKNGRTKGTFSYTNIQGNTEKDVKEDVGDMVKSEYLTIEDRNYQNEDGYIVGWTEDNPTTSHRIYHDIEGGITNFKLEYKYMYL